MIIMIIIPITFFGELDDDGYYYRMMMMLLMMMMIIIIIIIYMIEVVPIKPNYSI